MIDVVVLLAVGAMLFFALAGLGVILGCIVALGLAFVDWLSSRR